jgi:hypothetical protein
MFALTRLDSWPVDSKQEPSGNGVRSPTENRARPYINFLKMLKRNIMHLERNGQYSTIHTELESLKVMRGRMSSTVDSPFENREMKPEFYAKLNSHQRDEKGKKE